MKNSTVFKFEDIFCFFFVYVIRCVIIEGPTENRFGELGSLVVVVVVIIIIIIIVMDIVMVMIMIMMMMMMMMMIIIIIIIR